MRKRLRILLAIFFTAMCFAACDGCDGCSEETNVAGRYEINVEYAPESGMISGTEKCTFENTTDNELSVLKFQLYPNAYRENAVYKPVSAAVENAAYYAGESYGEMVISSVNGAKNWEVMGEDENVLYAYLERTLYPGDKVVLDIAFMVRLAKVNHRTGITENTVNLGNFFPILCGFKHGGFYETAYYSEGDPFYTDCADFTVTVKLPKEYTVASSGEVIAERTLESKKEHTMYATNVRDFAIVLSNQFRVLDREINGKTLYYYYYKDELAQENFEVACEAFSYFEKTFGEYPYSTYSLTQTGFCTGGMEYPALVMIADGLDKADAARVIAHETAHQWWYAVVGSDQIENAWQDEGLAEYSAITFFETYEKYGVTREAAVTEALKEYRSYYDVYGSVLGRTDTAMTRHLKDYISGYEYKCLAYDKAVVMFDTLRKSVGDKKFFAALKKYYKDNRFAMVGEGELVGAFEKSGLDVHGYFDSFLQGKAIL
ncbi:MAG: M1 family metallopeptidase [Clostridia bacterium]|nr:M1 family metallopeptidase [Clostridia bacterium]